MAEKKTAAKKPAEKKETKKPAPKKDKILFRGRVIDGSLYIRTAPEKTDGNIKGILENGTLVDVLEANDGWLRIKEGWIMARFVQDVTED